MPRRQAGYVFNDGIVIVFAMLFPVLHAKTAREVKNRLIQAEQFTAILNGRRTARRAPPVTTARRHALHQPVGRIERKRNPDWARRRSRMSIRGIIPPKAAPSPARSPCRSPCGRRDAP